MAKKRFWVEVFIVTILVFGVTIMGCDEESGTLPETVTYTGTASGNTYTLKITQNINNRSFLFTPTAGDKYELIFSSKKSIGTVISFASGIFSLQPSNPGADSFTATVSGNNISKISGTITWDDNETDIGPGSLDAGNIDQNLNGTWSRSNPYVEEYMFEK